MAEECIALGCREPVRGEDLLLCPTHAVAWRETAGTPPDYGAAAQGWEQQMDAQRAAEAQGEIVGNGIFTLDSQPGAPPWVVRATDAALIKAYPHSMTRVFQEGGRWYDSAVMAPRSASTPLVENCRWCRDGFRSGAACRQHPDLLALGAR